VVVYKIDRLSRSLKDFLNLIDRLERSGVTFVAVTQSFNTTTSMGRLTLNVLLSFAQFERELTGERLRDKFAASRARGMWLSGPRPFGFRVVDHMLVVDPEEAGIVRHIFSAYPKLGSAKMLARSLTARGILNRHGRPFSHTVLIRLLNNRLYRGEMVHRGRAQAGFHDAIVTEAAWTKVRSAMAESAARKAALRREPVLASLKGLLFGLTGHAMVHSFVTRRGKLYRYYVSTAIIRYGPGSTPAGRFRALDLEAAVLAVLDRAFPSSPPSHRSAAEAAGFIRRSVDRIDIGPTAMMVTLKAGRSIAAPLAGCIDRVSAA
jgi:hypothetical protein